MSDQLIPDGTYCVRGPGGNLTMADGLPGVAMLPPDGEAGQRWTLAAQPGGCTLRSVGTGRYLGSDGDPNDVCMVVKGTVKPFAWNLSTGNDADETTLVLTSAASSDDIVLSMSLLRLYPPLVAMLPASGYSTVEWAFDAV